VNSDPLPTVPVHLPDDESYTDDKGRVRWRRNEEIGTQLKALHDYLVIGGYDASHAARYPKLAYTLSRHPESIVDLYREGRLREIPGVGGIVATILMELLETGTTTKGTEAGDGFVPPPRSVLEMTEIPGLGALMARRFYADFGITDRAELRDALEDGRLDDVAGLGPKMREKIRGG
jgi:DNA polymerase (family X)